VQTAAAEDILVIKAFAAQTKDWADVEGLLMQPAGQLDWRYLEAQLAALVELKGEPEILSRLALLRDAMHG